MTFHDHDVGPSRPTPPPPLLSFPGKFGDGSGGTRLQSVGRSVGCDSRSERMIGGFGCGVGVSLLLFLEEWCEYCCARICAARLFMIMLGRLAGE